MVTHAFSGYYRLFGVNSGDRLPVKLAIMRIIKQNLLSLEESSDYENRLFWATFTLTFFALLWVNEFTDSNHTILFSDVTGSDFALTIVICSSKTDHHGTGCILSLDASSPSLCPVQAKTYY